VKRTKKKRHEVFEIRFLDIIPETQNELLRFFNVKSAEEMNWDVFAVAELTKELDNLSEPLG
jgi:hypothetical protein